MELILDFIGGCFRYLLHAVLNIIKGKETKPFSSFFKHKELTNDIDSNASNEIIGFLVLAIILVLIYITSVAF